MAFAVVADVGGVGPDVAGELGQSDGEGGVPVGRLVDAVQVTGEQVEGLQGFAGVAVPEEPLE